MLAMDSRIVVTGGHGFLGKHVCQYLLDAGYINVRPIRHSAYNLVSQRETAEMYRVMYPQVVIHLAAKVGGIGANKAHPGLFFYENMQMGLNVLEGARIHRVQKFIGVSTVCSYPKYASIPFKEENIWNGYPEETNAPYGIAKKGLMLMATCYNEEYGMNTVTLIPVNMYGPGDNFDPETSHVIPAIIRKIADAQQSGKKVITLWGTGGASREFLYVKDCASAIVAAMECYDDPTPVNIGTGVEIKIKNLAEKLCDRMNFDGTIVYDDSKPDGQPRRCLDTRRAEKSFGFRVMTTLNEGLTETIKWWRENNGQEN